jgi:hypothetical protein
LRERRGGGEERGERRELLSLDTNGLKSGKCCRQESLFEFIFSLIFALPFRGVMPETAK